MPLRVVTPPGTTPVSLVEAKAHLRLEESVDDAYVAAIIEAARSHVEKTCERALVRTTVELTTPAPECLGDAVRLLGGSLQAAEDVLSVSYLDTDDVLQSLALVDVAVVLGGDSSPGLLLPASGSWPTMSARPDALRVQYRVGWPTAAEVPAPLRHAVLLMVSQLYEHRTPEVAGSLATSSALEALMAPYRIRSI